MIGQSETENSSHITFSTFLGLVLGFVVPFTRLSKLHKCWTKTILLSQTSMFWLFFIQFYFQGHTNHRCQSMRNFECQLWSFPNPRLQWVTSKLSQQTFSLQQPISVRTCFPSPRKNSTTSSLTILWRRRDRSIKQHHVLQNIATDMRILNQVASKAIRVCAIEVMKHLKSRKTDVLGTSSILGGKCWRRRSIAGRI